MRLKLAKNELNSVAQSRPTKTADKIKSKQGAREECAEADHGMGTMRAEQPDPRVDRQEDVL